MSAILKKVARRKRLSSAAEWADAILFSLFVAALLVVQVAAIVKPVICR